MAIVVDSSGRRQLSASGGLRTGNANASSCCPPPGVLVTITDPGFYCKRIVNGYDYISLSVTGFAGSYSFPSTSFSQTNSCSWGSATSYMTATGGVVSRHRGIGPFSPPFYDCTFPDRDDYSVNTNSTADLVFRVVFVYFPDRTRYQVYVQSSSHSTYDTSYDSTTMGTYLYARPFAIPNYVGTEPSQMSVIVTLI